MNEVRPNRRVLIIDDNPAIHEDFAKILRSQEKEDELQAASADLFGDAPAKPKAVSFELDSAFQGQEGLEKVKTSLQESRPYAMAFVDIRMPPGWDGIETIERIWQVYPELQIVICTAYSDYSWEEMTAKVGQSDRLVILKKPFDNVEVLQLANALTEKWRLLQQARNYVTDLETIVKQRTDQLRKSEEQFRLITENAADLIALIDLHGNRLYNSPSYQRLLGYSPDELKKNISFGQIHPDDRDKVVAAAERTVKTGVGTVLEYRMQHKNGSWRTLESHGAPFRNAAGEIEGLLIVARDVTDRKEAEQQRVLLEVQLRQAQKLESIGQLAAGIAHEINTPTQFIGDNTRFLQEAFGDLDQLLRHHEQLFHAAKQNGATPELIAQVEASRTSADAEYLAAEIPKAIQQSLDGVERVSKIVRAMKEFSHPSVAEKSAVDLNRAIESTITVARNEWKYVADVVTEFDPALPPVSCLPGEFNQVILNLIVNAAHAIADVAGGSGAKGTITVSTRRDGDWVEIRIRDTGTGIPEAFRNRIFEPFFTTKQVGKGTGQGLAIARSVIVDKHGGTLNFDSEMGKGTCFIIRLPLTSITARAA